MHVKFEHYRVELSDEELRRYGSPHFSDKEAGEVLQKVVIGRAGAPKFSETLEFARSHILAANEVFSECAVADPLADLDIWDEWQSGERHFPFPGAFSRLGIKEQNGKVASSSAIGVIGEVFSGLFCQSYIAPWVLVRPIRRWPDFIYYTQGGRYAFVEAKGFTGICDNSTPNLTRIPRRVLRECLVDTVQQLNADPFATVWLMFTELNQIDPLRFSVTAIELDAPDEHRDQIVKRIIPDAVIKGLTDRVLSAAIASKDDSILNNADKKFTRREIQEFWDSLLGVVPDEIERVIGDATPPNLYNRLKVAISDEASDFIAKQKQKRQNAPQVSERGQRYVEAKAYAAKGMLGQLRQIGAQYIYLADLVGSVKSDVERKWTPDWWNANDSLGCIERMELYRCSSVAVGIGPYGLAGQTLRLQRSLW